MNFFAPFCIPFMAGAAVMFLTLLWKWGTWLYRLPRADKMLILRGLPTRAHVAGRVGGHPRVAPPPEDLPRQSPAGLHAHVAGLRLVSPDLGGLDRDGGLPRVPLRAPAGSRLLQVFRHGTRTQARLRPPDGPAAALCPLGRGPGLGQAFLLAGNGHAPHDETRLGRPHRPVGPVVHLPGTPAGREHDLARCTAAGAS